jgi:hypothetical protein
MAEYLEKGKVSCNGHAGAQDNSALFRQKKIPKRPDRCVGPDGYVTAQYVKEYRARLDAITQDPNGQVPGMSARWDWSPKTAGFKDEPSPPPRPPAPYFEDDAKRLAATIRHYPDLLKSALLDLLGPDIAEAIANAVRDTRRPE